jgi:type IV secretory pathway VirB3-like protein
VVLAVMVVPSMLFIAGLLFLIATTTRSLLATYVGMVVYFVLQITGALTRDVDNHWLAALSRSIRRARWPSSARTGRPTNSTTRCRR